MGRTIIFDADDTLWRNGGLYDNALDRFGEWCENTLEGVTKQRAMELAMEWNLWLTNKNGVGVRTNFPSSLMKAYDQLLREEELGEPTIDEVIHAYRIGDAVFKANVELYPETISTLAELIADGWNIVILTVGDEVIQSSKILGSGIHKFIDRYHIVSAKTKAEYEEMKTTYGDSIIMVGNSVRSDVNPAIAAGILTIHIPCETWCYEQAERVESPLLYEAHGIGDVPDIVRRIKVNHLGDPHPDISVAYRAYEMSEIDGWNGDHGLHPNSPPTPSWMSVGGLKNGTDN